MEHIIEVLVTDKLILTYKITSTIGSIKSTTDIPTSTNSAIKSINSMVDSMATSIFSDERAIKREGDVTNSKKNPDTVDDDSGFGPGNALGSNKVLESNNDSGLETNIKSINCYIGAIVLITIRNKLTWGIVIGYVSQQHSQSCSTRVVSASQQKFSSILKRTFNYQKHKAKQNTKSFQIKSIVKIALFLRSEEMELMADLLQFGLFQYESFIQVRYGIYLKEIIDKQTKTDQSTVKQSTKRQAKTNTKTNDTNAKWPLKCNLSDLSVDQAACLEIMKTASKPCLIQGVTGSGKTEVYFHLIQLYLTQLPINQRGGDSMSHNVPITQFEQQGDSVSHNVPITQFEQQHDSMIHNIPISQGDSVSHNIPISQFEQQGDSVSHNIPISQRGGDSMIHNISISQDNSMIDSIPQVLILLPEIALISQVLRRFKQAFDLEPAVWHSQVSAAKKKQTYNQIRQGAVKVIIGTRSASFLPYKNLKLVIVDEEHDDSYKQEDQEIYDTKQVLELIHSQDKDLKICLLSATPSLSSLYKAKLGLYEFAQITTRHKGIPMPEIEVIDMSRVKSSNIISDTLDEKIQEYLKLDHQVMLYLNKRGYYRSIWCTFCNSRLECVDCSAGLIFHNEIKKFICHHCGYSKPYQPNCNSCGQKLKMGQMGSEQLRNLIAEKFPNANPVLISSDTMKTEDQINENIQNILNKHHRIIIATQILAKGYHFPDVNLIGILDIDSTLSNVDLYSFEKNFQLLSQVSGRVGRVSPGKVCIQTASPNHSLIRTLTQNNFTKFAKNEMRHRIENNMPPSNDSIAIILSSSNQALCESASHTLRKALVKVEEYISKSVTANYDKTTHSLTNLS